jgi:hypothetical protein
MGKWRYSSTVLDLGTRWRRVVYFMSLLLYPVDRACSNHWIGGFVGPGAGLDSVKKIKIL